MINNIKDQACEAIKSMTSCPMTESMCEYVKEKPVKSAMMAMLGIMLVTKLIKPTTYRVIHKFSK